MSCLRVATSIARASGSLAQRYVKRHGPALSLRVSNPRLLIRNGYAIRCLEALQAASERRPWVEFRPLQYESSLHSSIGRSPRKSQPSNTTKNEIIDWVYQTDNTAILSNPMPIYVPLSKRTLYQDTQRSRQRCVTTTSTHSVSPDSMFRQRLNPIEPPWYATRMPGGVGGAAP